MAVEAALLGNPSFLVSRPVQNLGNKRALEKEYALMKNYLTWETLIADLEHHPELFSQKTTQQEKSRNFRRNMPDMKGFILQACTAS